MMQRLVRTDPEDSRIQGPAKGSVYQAFAETARANPARVAIEWNGQEFTYNELLTMAGGLASQIAGVDRSTTPVGVLADNSPHQVATYLAASLCSRPYAPLSSQYPQHMLQELIDRFGIRVLAYDGLGAARARELRVPHRLDLDRRVLAPAPAGHADRAGRAPATGSTCLMFTSGSTGRPKGVGIPYRAIHNLVDNPDYVRLGPNERMAYVANPAFDASLFEIWGALLNGGTLVHLPRHELPDPDGLAELLRERRISIMFITTALFNLVAKARPSAFRTLKYVLFGGERVSVEAVREVWDYGRPAHLVHVYGPTECTTFSTFHEVTRRPETDTDLPIGRAIKGAGTAILDADGAVIAGLGTGELYISGDGVATGYVGDPELTMQRFVSLDPGSGELVRAYRTGDLVTRDAQGDLVFIERLDDQVKRRGFRFSLREVDEDLLAIPAVRSAKTIKLEAPGVTCRVFTFVKLEDCSQAAQRELKAQLMTSAPSFRIPNHIIALSELPLNANGKVDVARLQRIATEHVEQQGTAELGASEAPVGAAVAAQIRAIFRAHCLDPQELIGSELLRRRRRFAQRGRMPAGA